MKRKQVYIIITMILLVTNTLACGLFGGSDGRIDGQGQTTPSVESSSTDDSHPEEQASFQLEEQSETQKHPDVDLDDEYRSEAGGYAFQPISGYEFEEFFGLAALVAPDADPDLGPMLMLIGGINEEETTDEQIFDNFMKDAEREDVKILEQKEIIVDGKSGLLADIAGNIEGEKIVGRIVVVAVTPAHQFTMFASAPQNRWDVFKPSFDAVLDSIHFFEPQDPEFIDGMDEATPDSSENELHDDAPIPEIPSLEEFPTEANQLPAGGFAYLLASSEGFPTIVAQGSIQDQSTSAEYVIGLVSENQDNALTLFLPLDIEQGVYPMNQYDPGAAAKAPSAAVYRGFVSAGGKSP